MPGRRSARARARGGSLTGLGNRGALDEHLQTRLRGPGGPLAVLLIDLDRFEDINDTLGHHVGDELHDPARDQHSRQRLRTVGELREGVDTGQLVVQYQPQCDVATGATAGLEALVRWQHPVRGLLGGCRCTGAPGTAHPASAGGASCGDRSNTCSKIPPSGHHVDPFSAQWTGSGSSRHSSRWARAHSPSSHRHPGRTRSTAAAPPTPSSLTRPTR